MKNRDSIYLVVRIDDTSRLNAHVCEAHSTMEAAEEKADAYNQKWKDKGWDMGMKFEVWTTTYYDET